MIPFGTRLADLASGIHLTHRALVVAYGDRPESFQVFLPTEDPGTQRVVGEFRNRLGDRWLDEDWELMDLWKRLGIRVGWAGLKLAWEEGDFSLLRFSTLIPLAAWCVLVWFVFRRFRS